ncbi:hypothetical protein [Hansschlegelia sp.]|uniref:hypothetical protein n=1 Tax=Hansschlegelia sp. TaxID=2041892 RepID=UPI002C48527F|nr:hypothetical protein [Hansschlegelia sp.]HVI30452.1 hypothetical protein [Hansschlegelia sp.]
MARKQEERSKAQNVALLVMSVALLFYVYGGKKLKEVAFIAFVSAGSFYGGVVQERARAKDSAQRRMWDKGET